MSVEHDSYHGEAYTDIIAIIFLSLLAIPAITKPIEDVIQGIVAGEMAGGHH